MALRTPLALWGATFFGTLGLSSLNACGGTTVVHENAPDGGGGEPAGSGGATSGSGGKASNGGAPGTGGKSAFKECVDPTPRGESGFVDCGGGGIHRTQKGACPSKLPRTQACTPQVTGYPTSCTVDSDCKDHPDGYCETGAEVGGCFCSYGCTTDAECGAGNICVCGEPVGHCAPATCTADGECAGGGLCLSYTTNPGCGGLAFACQSKVDSCVGDADCPTGQQCGLVNGVHQCSMPTCAIGRPFLVDGAAQVASRARRRDWSSALSPSVEGLSAAARAELAARWTEIGLMEHASIAAFARFALDLLSLGAPPSLVVSTHQAMADETVHARDAFALASAYAGHPVGPGALDVGDGSVRSARDIVRTAILEGCVGETVAAVEAAEALADATDPVVREVLARVTRDETHHAQLAFRFVQWVLEQGNSELARDAARDLVEIVQAELAATRAEIRRRVIAEVVLPCARALVARSRRAQDAVAAS